MLVQSAASDPMHTGMAEWLAHFMIEIDPAGESWQVSPSFYIMHGLPAGSPLSRSMFVSTLHPLDQDAFLRNWDTLTKRGGPILYTYHVVHQDGRVSKLVATGRAVPRQGRCHTLVGTVTEIIEDVHSSLTEPSLKASIESAPIGIARVDRDGRIIYANAALRSLANITRWDDDETHLDSLFWKPFNADDLNRYHLTLDHRNDRFCAQAKIRRFDKDVWVLVNVSPVRDPSPVPQCVAIVRDITQRKVAEDKARIAEQRFKAAIAQTSITVFQQDTALRYQWIYNPKLGYDISQVIGKTDHELMVNAAADKITAFKRKVMETREPDWTIVEPENISTGQRARYRLNAEAIISEDGERVEGIICTSVELEG